MRLVRIAGLAGAVAVLAPAGGATADTFCTGGYREGERCDVAVAGVQEALDVASARPGPDRVRIGFGDFSSSGFVYSDRGSAANRVTIAGTLVCHRLRCGNTRLLGGAPGGSVLSFAGGGGADVAVESLYVEPVRGATGLVLPPGGVGRQIHATAEDGSTGVRLAGSASRPAVLQWSGVVAHPGGQTDVGVDVPDGHGIAEDVYVSGDIGVRSRGSGETLIRGGSFTARVGVTASRARIAGAFLHPMEGMTATVGIESACDGAGSPDATVQVASVTMLGEGRPGAVGVRAAGRGGDGESCDARLELNSSIARGFETALDARGEQGSGASPAAGRATVHARYSDFEAGAVAEREPAGIETTAPGGNVDVDPGFVGGSPRPGSGLVDLRWDSPLVDAGDPAPLADWESGTVRVAGARRDIGLSEYLFQSPQADPRAYPPRACPGTTVELHGRGIDFDSGEIVALAHVWRLPDGSTLNGERFTRTFDQAGLYRYDYTATDPTGRSAGGQATVAIATARVRRLRVERLRGRFARETRTRWIAQYQVSHACTVRLALERARLRGGRLRWRRLPGIRTQAASGFGDRLQFGRRWRGTLLRPGRYRIVARPAGGKARRARFRVVR